MCNRNPVVRIQSNHLSDNPEAHKATQLWDLHPWTCQHLTNRGSLYSRLHRVDFIWTTDGQMYPTGNTDVCSNTRHYRKPQPEQMHLLSVDELNPWKLMALMLPSQIKSQLRRYTLNKCTYLHSCIALSYCWIWEALICMLSSVGSFKMLKLSYRLSMVYTLLTKNILNQPKVVCWSPNLARLVGFAGFRGICNLRTSDTISKPT